MMANGHFWFLNSSAPPNRMGNVVSFPFRPVLECACSWLVPPLGPAHEGKTVSEGPTAIALGPPAHPWSWCGLQAWAPGSSPSASTSQAAWVGNGAAPQDSCPISPHLWHWLHGNCFEEQEEAAAAVGTLRENSHKMRVRSEVFFPSLKELLGNTSLSFMEEPVSPNQAPSTEWHQKAPKVLVSCSRPGTWPWFWCLP